MNTCEDYKTRKCTGKGKKGEVWTVPELKVMLKALKLPISGNKADLCARLDQECEDIGVDPVTSSPPLPVVTAAAHTGKPLTKSSSPKVLPLSNPYKTLQSK